MLDYKADVKIDESALDLECLQQPRLMLKYGQAAARASKIADLAKEQLEVVKAELDEAIRSNPEKFGLAKVTEAIAANAITRDERCQEATKAFIQAKYDAYLARTASNAIDARKDMLELLVRLHGQQYFAGPKVPRDLSYEWQQKQKQEQSNAAINVGPIRRKV